MLALRPFLRCLTATSLIGLTSIACTQEEPSLHVFAAASLSDVMLELKEKFEAQNQAHLELSFASSNALARQIEASSYADVFLSADPQLTLSLEAHQRQDRFMSVPLVIIQNRTTAFPITDPNALLDEEISKLIVGEPSSVPVGRYAQKALGSLYPKLASKQVAAPDARAVLRMVEAAENAAGIVYATDAASSKRVQVSFTFSPANAAHYSWLSTAKKRNPKMERRLEAFESFLISNEAKRIFQRRGFSIP